MRNERLKNNVKQLAWEVVGSVCIAVGIYNFAVQAEFPMTGFSGISIILYQLFGVPIGLSLFMGPGCRRMGIFGADLTCGG